tara:strand:- start:3669 stop:4049 length:381 start_codon:yes stop_codon:yes gene_type:complete
LVYSFIISILLLFVPVNLSHSELVVVGGKMYTPKDKNKHLGQRNKLTRQQKIQQGLITLPRMVTCRLKKRVKTKSGEEVCIYQGQNKTYEMAIENKCPREYKCKYNPYGSEPNIGSVIDSLNEAVK